MDYSQPSRVSGASDAAAGPTPARNRAGWSSAAAERGLVLPLGMRQTALVPVTESLRGVRRPHCWEEEMRSRKAGKAEPSGPRA